MTRINIGIPPKLLTRQHLLAEHREIKRIPNHIVKHGFPDLNRIPKKFTLGTGHIMFFMNKGQYTHKRYNAIHDECLRRGYNVQDYEDAWRMYFARLDYYNDWEPTEQEINLIKERLKSKSDEYQFL